MNGYTPPCEKPQRNTSLDKRKKESETMSTKLPRHTVLNAVETSAHCVICTLKRGNYDVLAQEPLRQITMFGPLNVLSAETSNVLDSLSYKKPGNVSILLQHGNSHGFSQGKELDREKRRLAAPQAASFCKIEWMAHLARPSSQGGCTATPVDISRTRHVPATDYTQAAQWARVIEPRFRRCLARAPFRKAPPAWSFPCALWRLLVDSNAIRGKQRHGIGFEQRATHSDVFDEVFRALVWHMSVSLLSKNNNKSCISGLRLVHTLDTAGKAYYSQLWKLVTHSWQRDYATGLCHRGRREQAIAQHGVLREKYRAAKQNLTAVLYDLTNAFACGAQESQAGDPASPADVVRAEVQNLKAREHLCQRLAGGQLRLDCADGQLAAKIGSGTLPSDTVASG